VELVYLKKIIGYCWWRDKPGRKWAEVDQPYAVDHGQVLFYCWPARLLTVTEVRMGMELLVLADSQNSAITGMNIKGVIGHPPSISLA